MKAPAKQVTFFVDQRAYDRCAALAQASSMATGAYVKMLFEAAYAARCRETGDITLDTAVSRIALLFGSEFDIPSIHQATGLSEGFVERTVEAWRAEIRAGQIVEARIA